jgi:hypothetical protein
VFSPFLEPPRVHPVVPRDAFDLVRERSALTGPTRLAGTPAIRLPGSTTVFCNTTAPAAITLPSPITAWSMTMAPMPMSTLSCTVQPCTMALWPMLTSLPMVSATLVGAVQHGTVLDVHPVPDADAVTSPRTTALYHTLQ